MPSAEQDILNWGPQIPYLDQDQQQEQQDEPLNDLATVYDDNFSQASPIQDIQFESPDPEVSPMNMQQVFQDFDLTQGLQSFVQLESMSSEDLNNFFRNSDNIQGQTEGSEEGNFRNSENGQRQTANSEDDFTSLGSAPAESTSSENSEDGFRETDLANVLGTRSEILQQRNGTTEDEARSLVRKQHQIARGGNNQLVQDALSMASKSLNMPPNSLNAILESLNNERADNFDENNNRTGEGLSQRVYDNNDINNFDGFNDPKGENFKIKLDDYCSIELHKFTCYTPKKTRIRNLRYVFKNDDPENMRAKESVDEYEAKNLLGKRGVAVLEEFRQRNTFTVEDCINEQQILQQEVLQSRSNEISQGVTLQELDPSLFSVYRAQDVPEPETGYLYTPKIRRTYTIVDADDNTRLITEGLCPYCPDIKFGKLKNSNYGHHLSIIHGVQTNGRAIPDPVSYGVYYCERANKQNWSNILFQGVLCPVDGCLTVCKVSRMDPAGGNRNRILDYLRHYKSAHKSGKLLDAMRRNAEMSAATSNN